MTARFGIDVDKKSFTTGTFIRLVVIVLGILIVPLQLLCEGVISEREQKLILKLQAKFNSDGECFKAGEWCSRLLYAPVMMMTPDNVNLIFYFLHLLFDSLLTFKTTLLTCVGLFWLSVLQMIFKSGRPFWDQSDITSYGHCKFDFASPSQTLYLWTFLGPYIIIMYLMKYNSDPSILLVTFFTVLLIGIILEVYFILYAYGQNYLFQMAIG